MAPEPLWTGSRGGTAGPAGSALATPLVDDDVPSAPRDSELELAAWAAAAVGVAAVGVAWCATPESDELGEMGDREAVELDESGRASRETGSGFEGAVSAMAIMAAGRSSRRFSTDELSSKLPSCSGVAKGADASWGSCARALSAKRDGLLRPGLDAVSSLSTTSSEVRAGR